MKKTLLFIAIISAALLSLCACSKDSDSSVVTSIRYVDVNDPTGSKYNTPATTSEHTYDVTPGLQDYDSDNNLIIKSTENRYVYRSDLGYIIFSFNKLTDGCIQVLEVRTLEDEEKAVNYMIEHNKEMQDSGNYSKINLVKNNVVCTVSIDNSIYGKYLKLTRKDVEADMPESLKCN